MAIESTQKAKLILRAQELTFTPDINNDYYLTVKLQNRLTLDDIASEVAALSTRQEDTDEVVRLARNIFRRMMWFLSSGYSVATPIGSLRPTVKGVLTESELTSSPDRSRLTLGVSFSMSDEMRQALTDAELDVEILKSTSGPQLYTVVSAQDAQNPEAVTRGEGVGVQAGKNCIIRGKNIKVGGTDPQVGVTLTRQDGSEAETFFFAPAELYPNTSGQVGFIMPASATEGSIWSVTLCTQLGASGSMLKSVRTVTVDDFFIVGQTTTPEPPSGEEEEGEEGQEEDPLA